MFRINPKKERKAKQARAESRLIQRAAAAGGRLEIVNIKGKKCYAVYPTDQIELNDPVICDTFESAEHFIAIDEALAGISNHSGQ